LIQQLTWNHTVAPFVNGPRNLHHYLLLNFRSRRNGRPSVLTSLGWQEQRTYCSPATHGIVLPLLRPTHGLRTNHAKGTRSWSRRWGDVAHLYSNGTCDPGSNNGNVLFASRGRTSAAHRRKLWWLTIRTSKSQPRLPCPGGSCTRATTWMSRARVVTARRLRSRSRTNLGTALGGKDRVKGPGPPAGASHYRTLSLVDATVTPDVQGRGREHVAGRAWLSLIPLSGRVVGNGNGLRTAYAWAFGTSLRRRMPWAEGNRGPEGTGAGREGRRTAWPAPCNHRSLFGISPQFA